MDIAVVTGAASGLGLAITRKLLDLGFRVYGLGGNYKDTPLDNLEFRPLPCDLTDPVQVDAMVEAILEKEKSVSVLVNNAKYYPPELIEDGAPGEFARSLNVNLLCPLILVRSLMESLKDAGGSIINISSATPETARGGPVGAASDGGLRWMNEVLFQQLRDFGVGVSAIYPEPNRWRPADAPKPERDAPQSLIDVDAVANAVVQIVQKANGNIMTEVVIRPSRLVDRKIPAMRKVPYPKPKPIPYTVPREMIEAEELQERREEDRRLRAEREAQDAEARFAREERMLNHEYEEEIKEGDVDDAEAALAAAQKRVSEVGKTPEESSNKRKRRRRGGKNNQRSDEREDNSREQRKAEPTTESKAPASRSKPGLIVEEPKEIEALPKKRRRLTRGRGANPSREMTPKITEATDPENPGLSFKPTVVGPIGNSRRKRRGRKPRPQIHSLSGPASEETRSPVEVQKNIHTTTREKPITAKAKSEAPKPTEPKPKKVAKKAQKKTAQKKTTTKKTVAKKAVKKVATKKTATKKSVSKKVARKSVGKKVANKTTTTNQ